MLDATTAPTKPAAHPSVAELFFSFLRISILGFGGVLAWARRLIVEEKHWLSPEEFNELFAFCQFMPGANIVNLSLILGHRLRGWPGAIAANLGLLAPAVALMIVLGALYNRFGSVPQLEHVLVGLGAATAGLFIATALKMAKPLAKVALGPPHVICLATIVALGWFRVPLIWVLVVLIPLSIAWAWRTVR